MNQLKMWMIVRSHEQVNMGLQRWEWYVRSGGGGEQVIKLNT